MDATARTVLVVGSGGALGSIVAETFASAGWRVLRGLRRPSNEIDVRLVDLDRSETLQAPIEEADLIVNPVADPQLAAERVVLEQGGLIINISAQAPIHGDRLRKSQPHARGTAILDAGRVPGLTNLMAAELLAAAPEADEVDLVTTVSSRGTSGHEGGMFMHEHLTARRRHRAAAFELPPPFGKRLCLEIGEQDEGWLGELAAGRRVSTFVCLEERPLQGLLAALNWLALMRLLPKASFTVGRGRRSGPPTEEPVAMLVRARRQGVEIGAATFSCRGDYRATAVITLATAEAAIENLGSKSRGCFRVDELMRLADLQPRLSDSGIAVEVDVEADTQALG
jgi:hypothetical protein